ncbi:hypothetical protein ABZW96_13660 [Nocardia sp. NPDC004168]|uniref:hypothetical protein n=1 Tax=Nocardia sp. NPDC004168 TaxID=3154452 RepID=UPI0033A955A8
MNSAENSLSPNTEHASDDILPLGPPALVLGIVLLGAGFAALLPARSWSRDYGSLVLPAYVLYISLAGSLSVWGLRLAHRQHVRALRSATDQRNSAASSVAQRARPSAETHPTFVRQTQRSDAGIGGRAQDR